MSGVRFRRRCTRGLHLEDIRLPETRAVSTNGEAAHSLPGAASIGWIRCEHRVHSVPRPCFSIPLLLRGR